MSSEYKEGVWYGWNGGECPVHPKSVIQVIRGDSEGATAVTWPADQFQKSNWSDRERSYSIIAFRVIKQHREPLDVWLRQGILSGEWHPCRPAAEGAILFREVLE